MNSHPSASQEFRWPIVTPRTWHYLDGTTSNGVDIQGKRSRIFLPRHRMIAFATEIADIYENGENK